MKTHLERSWIFWPPTSKWWWWNYETVVYLDVPYKTSKTLSRVLRSWSPDFGKLLASPQFRWIWTTAPPFISYPAILFIHVAVYFSQCSMALSLSFSLSALALLTLHAYIFQRMSCLDKFNTNHDSWCFQRKPSRHVLWRPILAYDASSRSDYVLWPNSMITPRINYITSFFFFSSSSSLLSAIWTLISLLFSEASIWVMMFAPEVIVLSSQIQWNSHK